VIESRVTLASLEALSKLGHVLQVHSDYTSQMGRGQAILHDSKTGLNFGASDPRADGAAIPEQPNFFWRIGRALAGTTLATVILKWFSGGHQHNNVVIWDRRFCPRTVADWLRTRGGSTHRLTSLILRQVRRATDLRRGMYRIRCFDCLSFRVTDQLRYCTPFFACKRPTDRFSSIR
jgi:hypothetical protein